VAAKKPKRKKTEMNRPREDFNIHVPEQIKTFFTAAVYSKVGDGSTTLFWTDRWLHGQSIADLARTTANGRYSSKETLEANGT
jgi:hypothetical protein